MLDCLSKEEPYPLTFCTFHRIYKKYFAPSGKIQVYAQEPLKMTEHQ